METKQGQTPPASAPQIILFDLDGTITDMNPLLTWATPLLYGSYKAVKGALSGLFGRASAAAEGPAPRHDAPAWHLPWLRRIVNPRLRDGFTALADHAEARGIHTGIVSNGFQQSWGGPLVKKYGLEPTMDAYVFREHIQKSGGAIKPDPFAILHALSQWDNQLSAESLVFFVGDMHTDITAALNAAKVVPYTIVPIAIGEASRAAEELRRLWRTGESEGGIIFADYREFLRYLENGVKNDTLDRKAAAPSPAPAL